MKCPKCQTENPETRKFCKECGAKLILLCPNCHFENLPTDKFCGECGQNLIIPTGPIPRELSFDEKLAKIQRYLPKDLTKKILAQRDKIEGERKQVTVMFCDIEGFTALTEKLGSEEVYSMMDEVYEILIHKVHEYEGTVNELTGDGIMALFGAPIALEDAPQRAIRSALAIHREMSKFSDKLKIEKRIPPIKMRIGIHTGPVVVGTLGNDLRVEFKAVGDTVNLASRMEELAESGATYVTGDTFKLTEGLFRFEALGEKAVKGKEEPVKAYLVIAPSTLRTRFDVSAERGLTPFVGRERELELLVDGFERSKSGRGQAFSITAEAGVGKSRLLYEFRKAMTSEDVIFLEGRCLSYSRGVAYHPVIDILKANFDILEGDGDFAIREKVKEGLKVLGLDEASTLPYLLELLAVKESGIDKIPMSPEVKKDRIFEALRQIVLKGSEIRPLILSFEDLHWIDKSSEDHLRYLLESIPGARVLLIFTYRPEFVHTWGAKSYHSQITLNRLSNRESLVMVSHLLGTEELDRKLEELILEKAEGIPFFIEELIKSLKDLKIIEEKDNRYRITKYIKEVTIPATIQDVIMARVDSLPEGSKGLLQAMSVVGREFSHDLIKRVTDLTEQELLSYLSILKDSELLYERGIYPKSTYIFKHALTQEVTYDTLLLKRRKEIHEKIGRAIEEIYPDRLGEFYEMLAYHYSKSDDLEKAYQYLKLSGNKATRSYSNQEAFRFYRDAIGILKQKLETKKQKKELLDIILLIAIPMRLLAFPEDSIKFLQEGERLCEELEDRNSLATLYTFMGWFHSFRGDLMLGRKYQEDSFEEAEKIEDIEIMAKVAPSLCTSYVYEGKYKGVVNITPKVITLLEKSQREHEFFGLPANTYSLVQGWYGLSMGAMGEFMEGERLCEKALSFAHKINHLFSIGIAELLYGVLFDLKGDGENSVKHIQSSIGYLDKSQAVVFLPMAWVYLGCGYYLLGELNTALKFIEKGLKMQMDTGISIGSSVSHCYLSFVHFDLGNLNEAKLYGEQALNFAQTNHEKSFEGLSWIQLGRIIGKTEKSQINKAEEYILHGLKILDELEMKPYYARGYFSLGELYADTGQKEKALENLKKAEAMFQEMGMDYYLARTKKLLETL